LLKNGHLLRFPHPSSLRRTAKYASLLRISGALHLTLFEQPEKGDLFSGLLIFDLPSLILRYSAIRNPHSAICLSLPLIFRSLKQSANI
jgi:hypothetical protein